MRFYCIVFYCMRFDMLLVFLPLTVVQACNATYHAGCLLSLYELIRHPPYSFIEIREIHVVWGLNFETLTKKCFFARNI